MTGPIDPIGRPMNARRHRRRAGDPAPDDLDGTTLPVPVAPARDEPRAAPLRKAGSTLHAHLIGQDNRRAGLRGGQPVLDEARSSYLGTEYSGAADRRPRTGRAAKTEI